MSRVQIIGPFSVPHRVTICLHDLSACVFDLLSQRFLVVHPSRLPNPGSFSTLFRVCHPPFKYVCTGKARQFFPHPNAPLFALDEKPKRSEDRCGRGCEKSLSPCSTPWSSSFWLRRRPVRRVVTRTRPTDGSTREGCPSFSEVQAQSIRPIDA